MRLIYSCIFHLLLFLGLAGAVPGADKPNVLFIAIDDLRPELGCYGVDGIISPNIDKLAAKGVQFDSAHCQLAVCNPSRVSLLTGLRPDSTKVWTLDVRFRETIPDAVTLPQHFKKNGYTSLGFGKIFHNPWPDDVSWSEPHSWPKESQLWSKAAQEELKQFKEKLRKEGKPEKTIDRLRARATEKVDIPDGKHIDGAIADQAITALQRLAGKEEPFFLAAGFVRPHLPFVVPKKYWDLYDPDAIPLPENASIPANSPGFAMNTMYELRDYFDYLDTPDPRDGTLTEEQRRNLKHGYYASISFIDAQVGRILGTLKSLGLEDNTIVVLWSDHGWKLGEHNSWCKQTNYEVDTRVPLIIHDPRARGNGTASNSLVELVDLFPTLCDLAGISSPSLLEGVSLKPILDDPEKEVKGAAVSQFLRRQKDRALMGYAYRTKRWRYVEWIDRKDGKTVDRELYDHSVDPGETANLSRNKQSEKVMQQLGQDLRDTLVKPLAITSEEPPGKAVKRPRIRFRNESTEVLEVFWLPETGNSRKVGQILPGKDLMQSSSMGHRFRITGPGIRKTVTVSKASETIVVNPAEAPLSEGAPNIVVIMGDDWSWPHASILGDNTVRTPNFDRIAREGALFENAFVSAPSCTPSRFSVASGQYHWRLGEGVNLGGSLAIDVPVYPDLLANAGFQTGFCRKGATPSQHSFRGNDPFGARFKNFEEFFEKRDSEKPFCFWYGAGEPHRPYDWQASLKSNLDLDSIQVPPWLPDNETIRTDLGDYYLKVEQLDRFAGEILARLEESGELENTIVVMTGDNGMPFPRAKATLFDSGTRVPLAIRWGRKIPGKRNISDFVNLTDLAPTFLEATGLDVPGTVTGRSLLPMLLSGKSGRIEPDRDHVLTGMERHVYPYPSRALRTEEFLYIRNFAPEGWPAGKPADELLVFDFKKNPWPTLPGAFSHNVDPGPTKQWMRLNDSPQNKQAFGGKPAEELYDLVNDPDQLTNLLAAEEISETVETQRKKLASRLTDGLRASGDPRFVEPGHSTFTVHGWTIHLSDELVADLPVPTKRMLQLLHVQLQRVVDAVPKLALAQLRQIPIWINPPYEGKRGTAEYHPEQGWLKKNGRNPAMARAIEITNVSNFPFENRRMPYVLLHELAHGYHDRILTNGYRNPELRAAYERARDSGTYDEVARFNGNRTVKDKAYGMSNPMEYFAESTEAYFGKNDFFPFTRDELKEHDPAMHDLVQKLWGDQDQARASKKENNKQGAHAANQGSTPNIVIIYADDLGYGDVHCYNPQKGKIATPHIDRLASRGMRFTDAHSSSAVCTPSRYTLLTGRYHWRTRLQKGIVGLWGAPVIKKDRMTIGTLARKSGYETACIGKWHLGWDWPIKAEDKKLFAPPNGNKSTAIDATQAHRDAWESTFSRPIGGGPITRGFDEYFGTDVPNWPPYCFISNDRTVGIPEEYGSPELFRRNMASVQGPALKDWTLEPILPALAEKAEDFIARKAVTPAPFLLYLPLTSPHTPLSVNEEWKGRSGLGAYADLVMETDDVVGRVVTAIEEAGLSENSLVLFTSDNGCAPYIGVDELEKNGHFPSGPFRGYKSDAWEGGHRVPLVVTWPGVVNPGTVSNQLVHQADLFATIADVLGASTSPEAGVDSFSFLPILKGKDQTIRTGSVSCSIRGLPSFRKGQWKWIPGPGSGGWTKGGEDQKQQLYDLSEDPGETRNLADTNPDQIKGMQTAMEKIISEGRSTPGPPQRNDVSVVRYPKTP